MATTSDYMEYVLDQVRGPWELRAKKMFGEYLVYVNDKPVLLVCDCTVFVKILPEIEALMAGAQTGFPYQGSKEHWVLDVDDSEHAAEVIAVLEPITPLPQPRKPRQTRQTT